MSPHRNRRTPVGNPRRSPQSETESRRSQARIRHRFSLAHWMRIRVSYLILGFYSLADRTLDRLGFDPIDESTMDDLRDEVNAIEPDASLGPILTPADAPRLFEILARLSRKIGCRFPSEVRLSHLPMCAVLEVAVNSYYRRPVLVLGLPCLHVWSIDELKAVLAHELVHLRHQDAVFAREILGVVKSLRNRLRAAPEYSSRSLRRTLASFCAYWVERLARPASRWMEFRADFCSAQTCGSECLSTALEKMAIVQPIFTEILTISGEMSASNVYRLFSRAWKGLHGTKYEQLRKRFVEESRADRTDLHPPVNQRIDRLRRLHRGPKRQFYPSLHLLDNPPVLERALHNQLFSPKEPPPSVFHPFHGRRRR